MINLTDGASNSPGITPLAAGQDDEAALKQRQAAAQALKDKQAVTQTQDNSTLRAFLDAGAGIGSAVMQTVYGIPASVFKPANDKINGAIAPIESDKNDTTASSLGEAAKDLARKAAADALKKKMADQSSGDTGGGGMGASDINASGSMGA